ncbi:MAG: hypothetical protein K5666_03900, partial [Bacilli bacterium]|nr:hypothetical protein [Bacilli bacterium]
AITYASSLSCPSDFTYYSYIKGLTDKVKVFKAELNRINNALKKSERKYNETIEQGEDRCKQIKTVDIVEKLPATQLESILD